jgi:hypothetical protein
MPKIVCGVQKIGLKMCVTDQCEFIVPWLFKAVYKRINIFALVWVVGSSLN